MNVVPRFIPPCAPVLRDVPPSGPEWLHEVKFDGWRVQLHKHGDQVRLFSRKGGHLSSRFPAVSVAALALPDCIIDAEIVANDGEGKPSFEALMHGDGHIYVWCFDIFSVAGRDIRALPLEERKAKLSDAIIVADSEMFGFAESFSDPLKLLAACDQLGFEGVVSKRRMSPYRSGPQKDWVKVKCSAWQAANKDRWELFNRNGRAQLRRAALRGPR